MKNNSWDKAKLAFGIDIRILKHQNVYFEGRIKQNSNNYHQHQSGRSVLDLGLVHIDEYGDEYAKEEDRNYSDQNKSGHSWNELTNIDNFFGYMLTSLRFWIYIFTASCVC